MCAAEPSTWAGAGLTLRAGGALTPSETGLGAVLAQGEGRFDVQAAGDVAIAGVLNPTVIAGVRNASHFFTYSADSRLKLESVAGDVRLQNDLNGLIGALECSPGGRRFPGSGGGPR